MKIEIRSDKFLQALKIKKGVYSSINILYCLRLEKLYCEGVECKTFRCYYCKGLKTLKGVPEIVENVFDCSNCLNLRSLDCVPKKCKTIVATRCPLLKNLDPLLKCEVKTIYAEKHLLDDYYTKKRIVDKVGYDNAMPIINMLNTLSED